MNHTVPAEWELLEMLGGGGLARFPFGRGADIDAVCIAMKRGSPTDITELHNANVLIGRARPRRSLHITIDGALPPSDWHKTKDVLVGTPAAADLDRMIRDLLVSKEDEVTTVTGALSDAMGSSLAKLLEWFPPNAPTSGRKMTVVLGGGALIDYPIAAWALAETLGASCDVYLWDVTRQRGIHVSASTLLPGNEVATSEGESQHKITYRDYLLIRSLVRDRPHIPLAAAIRLLSDNVKGKPQSLVGLGYSINWGPVLAYMQKLGDVEIQYLAAQTTIHPDKLVGLLPPTNDEVIKRYVERSIIDPIVRLRGIDFTSYADPFVGEVGAPGTVGARLGGLPPLRAVFTTLYGGSNGILKQLVAYTSTSAMLPQLPPDLPPVAASLVAMSPWALRGRFPRPLRRQLEALGVTDKAWTVAIAEDSVPTTAMLSKINWDKVGSLLPAQTSQVVDEVDQDGGSVQSTTQSTKPFIPIWVDVPLF